MKNTDSIEFKVSTRIVSALTGASSYIAEKEDRADLSRFLAEWAGVVDYFRVNYSEEMQLTYCDVTGNLEQCRIVSGVAFNA